MEFKIKIKGVEEAKKMLDPKIYQKAMRATLNDLSSAINTQVSKEIRERYTLPSARIKQGIDIKKAVGNNMRAILTFSGKPPGLQHYRAIQTLVNVQRKISKGSIITKRLKRARQMMKGVSVEVIKGRRKVVRGAFLATTGKGGIGVWHRKGKERLPILRLFGPSIRGMFKQMGGKTIAEKVVGERLAEIFRRNIQRYKYKEGGET